MATFASSSSLKQQLIILTFLFAILTTLQSPVNACFTSIFSFGDSITDTGNLLAISRLESRRLPSSAFLPNGRSFFHRPTGRRCDGRLIIDFLAEALGFPFLPPYYGSKNGRSEQFETGVNFAVAAATALNSSFLAGKGIPSPTTNISLQVQVNSFKDLLPSLCSSSSDCKELLRTSLIAMGEIGGNDYNHALRKGLNFEEIRELVPRVVDIIISSINELVDLGAVTFLVPGNFPIGCSPSFLTQFQGSHKDEYDRFGCLTWLNQFSEYHNQLLQNQLEKLRTRRPDINIVYADYYNPTMKLYHSPKRFGFKETLKVCCGSGGPYNYNASISCGYPPLERSCNDPSSYISWDGIHYTEATYKLVANAVFEDLMNYIRSLNREECIPSQT
ncbi:hypothetical protein like AT1G28570 [Hibiscus trionum]|uniref:Uncharacterized protein n=1 Tax=Hibiscus trionum TaxID=183268 RepID=A0A9W7I1V1_HIBTR|nr:hypothetical protein like AT1G28570 [Hibiscus trionum]